MLDPEATKRYAGAGGGERRAEEGGKVQEAREIRLLPSRKRGQPDHVGEEMPDSSCCSCCIGLRERCPRPRGGVSLLVTQACLLALLPALVWSMCGSVPGGNLFSLVLLFICSVLGGRLLGLVGPPLMPPLPPLLGMLLAGLLLRNVPGVSGLLVIDPRWSAALRNAALAIILTRAGLGLDPQALRRLQLVCVRVAVGPCLLEACVVALMSHLLLGMPWAWNFLLGFVLAAVSPAVVVPSMLLLQRDGYGVDKGIPTLLMAAGSFDDILAITGFSTCLGIAFSTGSTWMNVVWGLLEVGGGVLAGLLLGLFLCFFPSEDQEDLVLRRTLLLAGLALLSVFCSHVIGFPGAGGLGALGLSYSAARGWGPAKAPVALLVGRLWDVFQPLLFALIGAEIRISDLNPSTVGLGLACIGVGLLARLLVTFLLVHRGGFSLREKVFIAVAWMPKATVQAAIGSKALDMAREEGDAALEAFGLDVLTLAVLAILATAPVGALAIGLAGPRLLQRQVKGQEAGPGGQGAEPQGAEPQGAEPQGAEPQGADGVRSGPDEEKQPETREPPESLESRL